MDEERCEECGFVYHLDHAAAAVRVTPALAGEMAQLTARRIDRLEITSTGGEERAEHDGYETQDPEDVARQLADAAQLFARVLERFTA